MHKKIFSIISVYFFFQTSLFAQPDSVARKKYDDYCIWVTKSILLNTVDIVDSSICMVLNCAFNFEKIEKDRDSIPYCYSIRIDSSLCKDAKIIAFFVNDRFEWLKYIDNNFYLLRYKNREIIVDFSNNKGIVSKFFKQKKEINEYKQYLLKNKSIPNSFCLIDKTVTQEIMFDLFLKNKRDKIKLKHYKYSVDYVK